MNFYFNYGYTIFSSLYYFSILFWNVRINLKHSDNLSQHLVSGDQLPNYARPGLGPPRRTILQIVLAQPNNKPVVLSTTSPMTHLNHTTYSTIRILDDSRLHDPYTSSSSHYLTRLYTYGSLHASKTMVCPLGNPCHMAKVLKIY